MGVYIYIYTWVCMYIIEKIHYIFKCPDNRLM